ncbi:MAG: (d)CMP kinase [Proteobacteria bacterium]|nr:(d)CMP kinase [Pseudomonadota bacterium]
MIVAVDGPSGAGKSTVCREAAKRLSWNLLDTGAIYRCVALLSLESGVQDEAGCGAIAADLPIRFEASARGQRVFLGARDVTEKIRSFEVTQRVNDVATMGLVRAELLGIQRRLGRVGDVIVEGRDIGSVVFPDAGLKVFYTATPEARARRRQREFLAKGETIDFEEVVAQIRLRDETEYRREHSPLIQCPDAVVLDTSALDFEGSCQALMSLIEERRHCLEVKP